MSPTSRGRKGKKAKKTSPRTVPLELLGPDDACDCPACSGEELDPNEMIDAMLSDAEELVSIDDPLDAEVSGTAFVAFGALIGDGFDEALISGFIPEFEARATNGALAMLLAISAATTDAVAKAATAAADRLVAAGIPRPRWAAELTEPVTVGDCQRLVDTEGTMSMLVASFHRAGRSHAIVLGVDHLDCGAANDIHLLDGDDLPEALEIMRAEAADIGLELSTDAVEPAEFRWLVESALDARAEHDSDELADEPLDDDETQNYHVMAAVMRARMTTLPVSDKARAAHGDNGQSDGSAPTDRPLSTVVSPSGRRRRR
jgi:hypothetical protein